MKQIIFTLLFFATCHVCSSQADNFKDQQIRKYYDSTFVFNKIAFSYLQNSIDDHRNPEYTVGGKWKLIGIYKAKKWVNKDSYYLLISEENDTALIEKNNFYYHLIYSWSAMTASKYFERVQELKNSDIKKIMSEDPWIGMNEMELQLSRGMPDDIKVTKSEAATVKKYIYTKPTTSTFTLENGKLILIED